MGRRTASYREPGTAESETRKQTDSKRRLRSPGFPRRNHLAGAPPPLVTASNGSAFQTRAATPIGDTSRCSSPAPAPPSPRPAPPPFPREGLGIGVEPPGSRLDSRALTPGAPYTGMVGAESAARVGGPAHWGHLLPRLCRAPPLCRITSAGRSLTSSDARV